MYTSVTPVQHTLLQQTAGKSLHYPEAVPIQTSSTARIPKPFVEILEQPAPVGARFRYKCEGRSAGCIRGENSSDKNKSFPTIRIHGYQGDAAVVVSCVSKDGPPCHPHPHNLVGKTCTNGVCYKSINAPDMVCSFPNLGIQCVKKKDIKESLICREKLQVDPYGTGFSHHSEPTKINLNCLRLCFQVFIADSNGKLSIPLSPVISHPIFDNKTVSDLAINKISHDSASVTGGQEIILLCDQVNKDDIQIIFFEECSGKVFWSAEGKFSPHHVHRKAAICFTTPAYKTVNVQQPVNCFVQLRRPSDGAVGKPVNFTMLPLKHDPDGMLRKQGKFEALRLQFHQLPEERNAELTAFPRVFRQAVRSKASPQNSPSKSAQTAPNPYGDFKLQPPANFARNTLLDEATAPPNQKSNFKTHTNSPKKDTLSSHQKVEDILAIATAQIGMSASFCETPTEDPLDRLSSLDLGFDPSDLDVNFSGITFDSFTSSGLNLSASGIEMKSLSDKLQVGEKRNKES